MIKRLFHFLTTAALCLLFYWLGQLPGAPTPGELYHKAGAVVERIRQGGAEAMAADVMRSGREAVASVVHLPSLPAPDEAGAADTAAPVEVAAASATLPAAQGDIPRCW